MRIDDAPPSANMRSLLCFRIEMMSDMCMQFAWGAQVLRSSCHTLSLIRSGDALPWANGRTFEIMKPGNDACDAHLVSMGRSSVAQLV